jgi:hypothetical protein
MASQFDLAPRLAALEAAGMAVTSEYRGAPPQWLTTALDGVDLRVVNCKGVKPDDVVVMVKLSKLEELVAAANTNHLMERVTPYAVYSQE